MFGTKLRAKVEEVTTKAVEASGNLAEYGRTIVSMLAAILALCAVTLIAVVASGGRRATH